MEHFVGVKQSGQSENWVDSNTNQIPTIREDQLGKNQSLLLRVSLSDLFEVL